MKPAAAQGQVIVGLTTKTDTNPFVVKMKEGVEQEARKLGANARKVTAIEDMVTAGAKGILFSHNMPRVFEVADRVYIQRLGRRVAVIDPREFSASDAVAIMTGAMAGSEDVPDVA